MILDDGITGNFVFVPSKGDDRTLQFKFDATTGRLEPNTPAFVEQAGSPRHMVFDRAGRNAYLLTEAGLTVISYKYDSNTGLLSAGVRLAAAPSGDGAHILLHPTRDILYASIRFYDALAIFNLDAEGRAQPPRHVRQMIARPWDFAIDPSAQVHACRQQRHRAGAGVSHRPARRWLDPAGRGGSDRTPALRGHPRAAALTAVWDGVRPLAVVRHGRSLLFVAGLANRPRILWVEALQKGGRHEPKVGAGSFAAVGVVLLRRFTMKTRVIGSAGAMVLLVASGCVRQRPAPLLPPPLEDTGPPVSSYGVPAKDPKGMLHVVSFGLEPLPTGPDGQAQAYLHLRLAAVNSSDAEVWRLDPNDQLLLHGDRELPAAFAEASTGGPVLALARATRGYLDVYYALVNPADSKLTLAWRLHRGSAELAQSTDFLRIPSERSPSYAYYQPADVPHVSSGMGLGSWWWTDYYFWNQGPCWWTYRRADFDRRYPDHRGRWLAQDGRTRSVAANSSQESESYWRGASLEPTPFDRGVGWRSSPSEVGWSQTYQVAPPAPSVESGGAPAGSSPVSTGAPVSNPASGGDGKSSWRGGTGR